MKKNLLYLFTFVFALSLFTACSDDDDDEPKVDGWKEISKTYEGKEQLGAKINEVAIDITGKSVAVDAKSAEAATVTLNNIVPDSKTVTIDAKLAEAGGVYSLTGETTVNNNSKIKISGNITKGLLSIDVVRELSTIVTGNLKLDMINTGEATIANVYWNTDLKTGDPVMDAMIPQLGGIVGQLMAQKVSGVNVNLSTAGTFEFNWTKVGESSPAQMPVALIAALAVIQPKYVVIGNDLLITFDKNVLSLIPEGVIPFDIQKLVPLLTDLGGYYGIPLHIKQEGNASTFYVSKDMIIPMLEILTPIITPMIPEELLPMVNGLIQALPSASVVDLGLGFKK